MSAIRWATKEWELCPPEVIERCWLHCIKQTGRDIESSTKEQNDKMRSEMEKHAVNNGVKFTSIGMDMLLSPDSENEVVEEVTMEQLGRSIGEEDSEKGDVEEDCPERVEEDEGYSISEELKGLAVASAALDRYGLLDGEIRKRISACQRELRLAKVKDLTQLSIPDLLKTR